MHNKARMKLLDLGWRQKIYKLYFLDRVPFTCHLRLAESGNKEPLPAVCQ